MLRNSIRVGVLLAAWGSVAYFLAADDAKPVDGKAEINRSTYKLAFVVAYETKVGDDTAISVLASDRRIPVDKIRAALRENAGSDDRLFIDQPHVIATFKKTGEFIQGKAWADNAMFFTESGDNLHGELKLDQGRVRGQAKLTLPPSKDFKQNFDFRFDTPLGFDNPPQPVAKPAGPVKPSVAGKFNGNGKPAKLAFVSAHPREAFGDEPALQLVFTEKDHSREKQPGIRAGFGNFGSALIIECHENGRIFGCQVAHAAHKNQGFSSLGNIKTAEFDLGDGRVTGRIQTDGQVETFGDRWEVDITFTAPYAAPAAKTTAKQPSTADKPTDKPANPKPAPADEPEAEFNVHDLPFPKDVTNLEYKELAEQITFKSPTGVVALAKEFAKQLDKLGWKGMGADLYTAQSTIVSRTRGDATLTIMVKPSGKGSEVLIMSDGLDWDEKEEKK